MGFAFLRGLRTTDLKYTFSGVPAKNPYLAGDPAQVDTVKRIYLNGQRGVDVERSEDFETAGLKLRATLDFDARAFDYRGLYKNPGA